MSLSNADLEARWDDNGPQVMTPLGFVGFLRAQDGETVYVEIGWERRLTAFKATECPILGPESEYVKGAGPSAEVHADFHSGQPERHDPNARTGK